MAVGSSARSRDGDRCLDVSPYQSARRLCDRPSTSRLGILEQMGRLQLTYDRLVWLEEATLWFRYDK